MRIVRWIGVGAVLVAAVAAVGAGTGLLGAGAAPTLRDEKAKRSYALGVAFGNQLRGQSVDVDVDVYRRGLEDALAGGETLLTEAEVRAAIRALQVDLSRRQRAKAGDERASPPAAGRLEVSFKVDPRLTKSLYMGDRWVSAGTYASAPAPLGESIKVQARARAIGPGPVKRLGRPTWTASAPEAVAISSGEGGDVELTIRPSAGGTVTVAYGDASTAFTVRSLPEGDTWRVELAKQPATASARGAPGPAAAAAALAAER